MPGDKSSQHGKSSGWGQRCDVFDGDGQGETRCWTSPFGSRWHNGALGFLRIESALLYFISRLAKAVVWM